MFCPSPRLRICSHTGASFPMREVPVTRFESNVLRQPAGCSRTHLVDATAMPSMPATTVSLLMMATAYRVASQAPLS